MKILASIVFCLLACALCAPLVNVAGCRTLQALPQLEDLDQAQFDAVQADCALIAKVGAARLLLDGKASAETVGAVASALEIAASDPLATGGPTFITDALKRAGWTDDEVLLALSLAEGALRQHISMGETIGPLGQRARSLLSTVAASLRLAASEASKP